MNFQARVIQPFSPLWAIRLVIRVSIIVIEGYGNLMIVTITIDAYSIVIDAYGIHMITIDAYVIIIEGYVILTIVIDGM